MSRKTGLIDRIMFSLAKECLTRPGIWNVKHQMPAETFSQERPNWGQSVMNYRVTPLWSREMAAGVERMESTELRRCVKRKQERTMLERQPVIKAAGFMPPLTPAYNVHNTAAQQIAGLENWCRACQASWLEDGQPEVGVGGGEVTHPPTYCKKEIKEKHERKSYWRSSGAGVGRGWMRMLLYPSSLCSAAVEDRHQELGHFIHLYTHTHISAHSAPPRLSFHSTHH